MSATSSSRWNVVCHASYPDNAALSVTSQEGDDHIVTNIQIDAASGLDLPRRPIFLGVSQDHSVFLLDPQTQAISTAERLPADATPMYAYPDEINNRLWFVNDGDEDTGSDALLCGNKGSTVTVIEPGANPRLLKTLCVGRGHHCTAFVEPNDRHPELPRIAFVSNLLDGSITILGNDAGNTKDFLRILGEINLCEPDKEKDPTTSLPNNAFPHGLVFSPFSGKVYCLNNGYQTIAVIDPLTLTIETRIPLPVSSNLLLSPDGRFVIGKGADRKSNPEHVMGRISVVDLRNQRVATVLDLPDYYPSTFRFSPDGKRLFVTTAATGKGAQRDALNIRSLLVYDTSDLPSLRLEREITVGKADCGRRPLAFASDGSSLSLLFVPNPTDGTLTILDGESLETLDTVTIGATNSTEVLYSFWDGTVSGC